MERVGGVRWCPPRVTSVGCGTPGALLELSTASPTTLAYCIALGADGQRSYGKRFENTSPTGLPQSLGVLFDGHPTATARIDGIDATGLPNASVSVPLMFESDKVQGIPMSLPDGCVKHANSGMVMARADVTFQADRLAVVRSGAEAAGGAELIALGSAQGMRYDYTYDAVHQIGALSPQSATGLSHGASASVSMLSSFDTDNNCADDLVISTGTTASAVWPSSADGDFTAPAPAYISQAPMARAQAIGDVNNDHYADIVMVGDSGGVVLLSDQAGGFAASASFQGLSPSTGTAVALGDFDGDGIMDVVVGFQSGPLRWYSGNKDRSGNFTVSTQPLPGTFTTNQLLARDVDGDGRVDILAATQGGTPGLHVFLNQGDGTFNDATASVVPVTLDDTAVTILYADLDGNCVDDLIVLGDMNAPVWLDWSDAGTFKVMGSIGAPAAQAAAAGDLDGDLIVDLALITGGTITVYSAGSDT